MTPDEALDQNISTLAQLVASGAVSAEAVTQASLERIDHAAEFGALLHVSRQSSLDAARAVDQKRASGEALGALSGVPIAVKDALCTLDAPTTAASRILTKAEGGQGWRPPYDATVVARLRVADAIIIAKANMDEFAMGSSNENSAFGPVMNPWDETRVPGGSSGGSAVAVAARLTPGALGSDTGGSIRQPASMCGVVGVKPSYGRVSRHGLIAFASSLDQVGPFARDVAGAARLLSVIAGPDPHDSTASPLPCPDFGASLESGLDGLKVGVSEQYFAEGIRPEVAALIRSSIDKLREAGASIVPVELPHTHYGVATYYVLATAEASSNLSRFDGVRFGLRREEPKSDVASLYGKTRDAGFGDEVKRRILLGTYVLSEGYYDAYYEKAQRVRTLIKRDFERAFDQVDVIAAPVCPRAAFRLGDELSDPLTMYMSDVFAVPASLAGICAISVPAGQVEDDGSLLPVGLQFLAPAFNEPTLFRAGAGFERLSGWNRAYPTSA